MNVQADSLTQILTQGRKTRVSFLVTY
jgi:hypothetical protein